MSTDQAIEQQIQALGANVAPRITPDDIKANIVSEHYFTGADGLRGALLPYTDDDDVPFGGEDGRDVWDIVDRDHPQLHLLTFCVLVLRNGFTVTGESACASPENYNAEIGRRIARENAVAKIWPLMGYELRSKLVAEAAAQPHDCPHAAPHRYCAECVADPCPIGLGKKSSVNRQPYTMGDIASYEASWGVLTVRFHDGQSCQYERSEDEDGFLSDRAILQKCIDAHNKNFGGKPE